MRRRSIALARRYPCRVVGIDQSPDMLAGARDRIDAAGLAERIELVEAPLPNDLTRP